MVKLVPVVVAAAIYLSIGVSLALAYEPSRDDLEWAARWHIPIVVMQVSVCISVPLLWPLVLLLAYLLSPKP